MRFLVFLLTLAFNFSLFRPLAYARGSVYFRRLRTRFGGFSPHLGRYRGLGPGGARRRLAVRALLAMLLALLQTLQRLIDPHCQKLDHRIGHAQPALQLLYRLRAGRKLNQHVVTFAMLLHPVGEAPLAPFVDFVNRASRSRHYAFDLFDNLINLFFGRVRLYYKQLFVDSHSSSFEPWARRLNFVMAFSAPSAIMETTASAARPASSSNCFSCERFSGASK